MENIFRTLLFLMILCCNNLIAQSPYFKNYTVKDGLPSKEVYEVIQDSKGYIWMATDHGIAKFNGYGFKIFNITNGLPDNSILDIYEDYHHRIWCATSTGKMAYIQNDSIFCSVELNKKLSKEIGLGTISSMILDSLEQLCLETFHYPGMIKINVKNPNKPELIIDKKLPMGRHIKEIGNEAIQITNYPYEYIVPKNDRKYSSFILNNNYIYTPYLNWFENPFFKLEKLKDKTFLISIDNHILLFDSIKILNDFNAEGTVLSLKEDDNSTILVGQIKKGISFYSKNGNDFYFIKRYLDGLSVTSFLKDKEGGYWISTLEKGVFYAQNIDMLHYSHLSDKSLPEKSITCVDISNGKITVGTEEGLIHFLNKKNKTLAPNNYITLFNKSANLNTPVNFIFSKHNQLILGGLGTIIIENGQPKKLFKDNVNGEKFYSYCYNIDKHNNWWIGGVGCIYKIDKEKLVEIPTGFRVKSIVSDTLENIYAAGNKGVYKLVNNKFIPLSNTSKHLNTINCLKIDKKNYLWIGTKGEGLIIKGNDKEFLIKEKDGLLNNSFNSLFVDEQNNIWAASDKGINKIEVNNYSPFSYKITCYTTKNGLLSNQINQIIVKNDTVYIASNEGLTYFNWKKNKENTTRPFIHICNIKINDSLFKIKPNIDLTYSQNKISFSYVGLTYKDAGNTDYKYRLLGLDSSWTYTKYTSANYTTLPYGVYTFEVLAKNNDGYWSEKPAKISFNISPPFWHTWWFRTISAITLIAGMLYFTRARIRVIEKREMAKTAVFRKTAEMEKEKAELFQKAADMELKFLSSQMNPHFTFNSMNSIQYFLMNNETEKAQRYLVKYSKLIRLVLENNMQSLVLLEDEIKMLSLYMQIEALRFVDKFEFEILLSDDLKEKNIKIPPMVIQPYVENAIWHGLMNKTNGAGKIILSFSIMEDMLKCTIDDNGVGRKRAKEMSKPKEYQSLGMLITSARLEKMQATSIKNKINIIDKKDQKENACGTIVELLFPFNNE